MRPEHPDNRGGMAYRGTALFSQWLGDAAAARDGTAPPQPDTGGRQTGLGGTYLLPAGGGAATGQKRAESRFRLSALLRLAPA